MLHLCLVVAASVLVVVVGCGGDVMRSPAHTPTAQVPVSPWGPLAVASRIGGDDARTAGTLRITEDCVFLDTAGDTALLVWPRERTAWDAASSEILYDRPGPEIQRLRTGDAVALGGSGLTVAEDGPLLRLLSQESWVAAPASSCLSGSVWFVGDVE